MSMAKEQFRMDSSQIAQIMGTVGSPLIVISELLKNAVDASARNINISYKLTEKLITVENDYKGFSYEEILALSQPGTSEKKKNSNLTNEHGMFLTGSKGLGILSVFLLCAKAEIYTSPADNCIYKIILDRETGTVEQIMLEEKSSFQFTKVVLTDVSEEIISFLSSEAEVRKLRHICTSLYKGNSVPFPQMRLHISDQNIEHSINFSCDFPSMLYDVSFKYVKSTKSLHFKCLSPDKDIMSDEVILKDFSLSDLQALMLDKYGIKETISTRTNDLLLTDFSSVPTFEGRILVYEKALAGAQLKTYGAGVNIYVNEFALYNYLAEENDWLGLADYSQRKKVTRLKPHNVFGYVNFPGFDENKEILRISNERADFIQDLTFNKVMYLLKGVVMFIILNIDVADKNPKYKSEPNQSGSSSVQSENSNNTDKGPDASSQNEDNCNQGGSYSGDSSSNNKQHEDEASHGPYEPAGTYAPKKLAQKSLIFTKAEGKILDGLVGVDDLSNKIYDLAFELSKLDLQVHRHAIAYLYRAILESSTKYLSRRQTKVQYKETALETSITNVLNYIGDQSQKNKQINMKTVRTWRDTVTSRKLIDTLNQYIHNEQPVDALLLQETWNTMKGYIITCLTLQ